LRFHELHFTLMVHQHGLHVKDWLARVEPLLPAPNNTTRSQTRAETHLVLLSVEIQLNLLAELALFKIRSTDYDYVIVLIQLIFLSELWFYKKHTMPEPPLFCELLQRSETRPDAA
jgi:hypothetical protein